MYKISKSLCTNLPTAAAAAAEWGTQAQAEEGASLLSQPFSRQHHGSSPSSLGVASSIRRREDKLNLYLPGGTVQFGLLYLRNVLHSNEVLL